MVASASRGTTCRAAHGPCESPQGVQRPERRDHSETDHQAEAPVCDWNVGLVVPRAELSLVLSLQVVDSLHLTIEGVSGK